MPGHYRLTLDSFSQFPDRGTALGGGDDSYDLPATTSNATKKVVKSRNLELNKLAFQRKATIMMLDTCAGKHQANLVLYKKRIKKKASGFQDKPQILYQLVQVPGRPHRLIKYAKRINTTVLPHLLGRPLPRTSWHCNTT